MAYYKVLETSFIGQALVEVDKVIEINDDPTKGGMSPGSNLAKCDEAGNLIASRPATSSKKATTAQSEQELA